MRNLRLKRNNAKYHVTARVNRQELSLEDIRFKKMFLEVISCAKKKYRFLLQNFCIMGNHIHLEITPLEAQDLSKIMQWILSVFAVRYNKIFKVKGHFWYDRFKSKIIETITQYINTFLYIANNPVRAGIAAHPLDFAFSGIYFYINKLHGPLDPPEEWMKIEIDSFLKHYEPFSNKDIDKEYSFQDKKPGRPRKTQKPIK